MLHTKFQGSMPYGFWEEECSMFFPTLAYVKHVLPGAESYLVPGA